MLMLDGCSLSLVSRSFCEQCKPFSTEPFFHLAKEAKRLKILNTKQSSSHIVCTANDTNEINPF